METLQKGSKNGIYSQEDYHISMYDADDWFRRYRGFYIVSTDEDEILIYEKKIDRIYDIKRIKIKFGGILNTTLWVIFMLSALSLFLFLLYEVNVITCRSMALQTNLPWQYDFWAGCFLKYKDIYMPSSQIFQLIGK